VGTLRPHTYKELRNLLKTRGFPPSPEHLTTPHICMLLIH